MSVVSTSAARLSAEELLTGLSTIIGENLDGVTLVKAKFDVHPNFEVDPESQVRLWLSLVNDVFPRVNFKLNVKRKLFEFIYRFRYVPMKTNRRGFLAQTVLMASRSALILVDPHSVLTFL